MRCKKFTQQAECTARASLQNIHQSTGACSTGAKAGKVSGRKPQDNPRGRADAPYSSQGGVWQASWLCTCASNCGEHPGLAVVHRSPLACEPLPQDGHTAPALVQQGRFLDGVGLWGGQDPLLHESTQLFVEMCG